ncbi:DegV family protein [Clostridium senegalense]|uniref:DegV family protein n=1 Tax=Clostridium senegalense TaxID=1465809 RepID=UPI001C111BA6|nr:DegV family protein [Clostridium senegalense]MBU5226091.1 DegV family protein [Clostridium senegalense]
MNKIALITDSASDIRKDVIDKYNVKVLPFRIIIKDKDYRDGVDITLNDVYKVLDTESPTSSLPSMKDMGVLFNQLEKEGYTHVIAITISSKLSGLNNALRLVSEDYPTIKTEVIDSKSISCAETIIIKEAGEMINSGLEFEKIVEKLIEVRSKIKTFFIIGTLEYLKKGGRIGKVAGVIGELLNIKPIVLVDEEGEYSTYDKARGRKQSINKMLAIGKKILDDKKCDVYIGNGGAEEEAEKYLQEISNHPNINNIFFSGDISPVAGLHSGPGLLGIAFYEV